MRWPRLSADVLPLLMTTSPLIGVFTTTLVARWNERLIRPMVLSNAGVTVLLAIAAVGLYQPDKPGSVSVSQPGVSWLASTAQGPASGFQVRFALRLDEMNVWPALLLSLVVWSVLCSPGSWATLQPSLCIGILVTQCLLLAALYSTDAITGMVLLQMAVVPIAFLIGTLGDQNRRPAASRWWVWQWIGLSVCLLGITLLAVSLPWMNVDLVAVRQAVQFDAAPLAERLRQTLVRSESAWHVWGQVAPWGAALLTLGLLIRLPVFPFLGGYHAGLVSAPAGVAAIIVTAFPLAAVVGWLQLGMPLFLEDPTVAAILCVTAMASAWQSALAMRKETDLKRLLVWLSSALLGLVGVSLSFSNRDAIRGAWMLTLIQAGVVAVGLLLVQAVESRYGTRDLTRLAGFCRRTPWLAGLLILLFLGCATAPLAWGLAALTLQLSASTSSRLMVMLGESIAIIAIATSGLQVVTRLWNDSDSPADTPFRELPDIDRSEVVALAPLVVVLLLWSAWPGLPHFGPAPQGAPRIRQQDSADREFHRSWRENSAPSKY